MLSINRHTLSNGKCKIEQNEGHDGKEKLHLSRNAEPCTFEWVPAPTPAPDLRTCALSNNRNAVEKELDRL